MRLFQVLCAGCIELERRCLVRLQPHDTQELCFRPAERAKVHENFAELIECIKKKKCQTCLTWRKLLLRECTSRKLVEEFESSKARIWAVPASAGTSTEPVALSIECDLSSSKTLSAKIFLRKSYEHVPGEILREILSTGFWRRKTKTLLQLYI